MCAHRSQSPGRFITVTLDREELRARGRAGGLATHARYDSDHIARRARQGLADKFSNLVDPEQALPDAERERLVSDLRRSYFSQLGHLSAIARARKRHHADTPEATDEEAGYAA